MRIDTEDRFLYSSTGVEIRRWKRWEDAIAKDAYDPSKDLRPKITHVHQHEFIRSRFSSFGDRSAIVNLAGRPKRLLVFVNPFEGNKSASNIFLDSVKPLLEDADIQFTVQETNTSAARQGSGI